MLAIGNRSPGLNRLLSSLLAVAMVLVSATTAPAQPGAEERYKSAKPSMGVRAAKRLRAGVSDALNNAASFNADGKKKIDAYFLGYYFRQLTQTSPTALANLSKGREELFKKYLRAAKHPAAQQHLTNITLSFGRMVAQDNYHPSVRYNATLILGSLSKKYGTGGSNPTPPVPLPAGTEELLQLLEQTEFKGVQVHPSVKVAALEGLERHVRFGLDSQYADRVTQVAMTLLTQDAAVLNVNEDVNSWIKCQAASVLVGQFQEAPTAELQTALTKLLADDKMSLEDRCCIAALLQKLKYAAAANLDVASMVLPFGNLTQEVVNAGAEKAKKYEEAIFGSVGDRRPGFSGRGQGGRQGGREGGQETKLERRQLLSRLTSITQGARSLSKALPEEEKQKLLALTELFVPAMQVSGARDSLDLDVMSEVLKLKETVDTLVSSWQPAPAVTADDDFSE